MDKNELFRRRYVAVKNAMIKAKNPDFKDLWKKVMDGLISVEINRKDNNE